MIPMAVLITAGLWWIVVILVIVLLVFFVFGRGRW